MCVTIMKDTNFAFQSRVTVFALPCLQLQRLCIIAEEKPDSYDEEIYVWMNKVMAVVNNRHHESVFMIATVHPGSLPRHADGKIDIHEVSARLEKGTLHPSHVICCPHSAIHDLPRSKDRMLGMGPNSIMQGFVVAGASPAQITENPLQEEIEDFIHQQLITRASDEESARKHLIFSNPILPGADYVRMSPLVLHNKAQKMIKHLKSHGAQPRDKVLVSLRWDFTILHALSLMRPIMNIENLSKIDAFGSRIICMFDDGNYSDTVSPSDGELFIHSNVNCKRIKSKICFDIINICQGQSDCIL